MPSFSWKALWAKGLSTLRPTRCARVGELASHTLLVEGQLVGADRAEVERVEGDQDLAALEVGEGASPRPGL